MSFILALFTAVLVLVSLFIVFIVLMQRANSNSGMGSALGGGFTESTFGAETGNVLTRGTIFAAIGFFLISFLLYLGHVAKNHPGEQTEGIPEITAVPDPEPVPISLTDFPVKEAAEPPAVEASVPVVEAPSHDEAAVPSAEIEAEPSTEPATDSAAPSVPTEEAPVAR